MKRREFIKLSSLALGALATHADLLASNQWSLVEIEVPEIHIRHGAFDLHKPASSEMNYEIRRNIFLKDGFLSEGQKSMAHIFISGKNDHTVILNDGKPRYSDGDIRVYQIDNERQEIKVPFYHALIFSEKKPFECNGKKIEASQGMLIKGQSALATQSNLPQAILIVDADKV